MVVEADSVGYFLLTHTLIKPIYKAPNDDLPVY